MRNLSPKLKRCWWTAKLWLARMRYGNASRRMKIVGVTGTNGKTTTTTLLYKIATALGHKAGLIGTVEILIAGEKWTPPEGGKIPSTTPDSITLAKIFRQMAKAGCEYVFMEVSSHAVAQNRIAGIRFAGGIFTNFTQDHLDYHQSMENYFLAKRKFFSGLPKDAFALSNDDDEKGEAMVANIKAPVYFYSLTNTEPTCHIYEAGSFCGEIAKMDSEGLAINVGEHKIKSKLVGRFNAYNLLAVFAGSALLDFPKDRVVKVLAEVSPPAGRFDHFRSASGVLAVVDYAHTPDALENVLKTANDIKGEGRVITVFGCGGDRDPTKRAPMGAIGARLSDLAIFTSDNPRSEDPGAIITDMMKGLNSVELAKVKVFADRREAITEAVKFAKTGDIILLAGKGHEDYQEIKGKKNHFDDMEEIKKAFEQRDAKL